MTKKALVTGGAGFIGSHLCEELLARGFSVTAVDDLSTGCMDNIQHLLGNPKFFFRKASVLDRRKTAPFVAGCDLVYHLAAAVGVLLILDKPLQSILTNIEGTKTVLDLASRYRKKVVFASSSEVYGKHSTGAMKEDDDRVMGPTSVSRWTYAASKALDESLALAYSKEKKLRVVILRFFNVVGPRQMGRYGMVFPRFIQAALDGRPITVYGDGSQVRSFTYVKDAVRAAAQLGLSKKAEGGIFNVGNDEPVSINRLAKEVKRKTASSSKIVRAPYKSYYGDLFEDAMYRLPDITRMRKTIGYRPHYRLSRALDETIAYFKKTPKDKRR